MKQKINQQQKEVSSHQKTVVVGERDFPELHEKLIAWGLTKYEAAIYIYLLTRTTPTGGSKIAIGANLHRPYVYASLPRLIELSLVVEVAHGKQSKYRAMPPAQLEKIELKRAVETTDLIQSLSKMSKISYEQDAELFIGRDAIVKHQLAWVRSSKPNTEQFLLSGSGNAMRNIFGEDIVENTKLQAAKHFTSYLLCNVEEKNSFDHYHKSGVLLHIRSMPIIPEMFPTIAIRGDVVEVQSYFNPPVMYVIKSKDVAEKFKTFFLGLWEMAKE